MKTTKKLAILLASIFIALQFSCQDFLDERGYRTDYSYYETVTGLEALVGACYQQTRWCASSETQYPFEDLGTDIYLSGADGSHRDAFGEFLSTGMTPSNGNISGFWNNNYNGIASCNLALQYLEKNTEMNEATKNIRLGEVLFLRSQYYYELAIQFGDIPLITEPVDKPKTDYQRAPQKEIWATIISDLRSAWDLLPWSTNGSVTGDYGRASKGAVGHLLAKAYFYRYGTIVGGVQSTQQMQEDRGAMTTDLDSVIFYAGRVANFGAGAGNGSPHSLATNYSDLWAWDPKNGMLNEYYGSEILFSVQFHANPYYNNQTGATNVNDGGNQLHMFYTMYAEAYPLVTNSRLSGVPNVTWGTNVGISRDFITDRPWRRLAQTPFVYMDNGLYGRQAYDAAADGKPGKLIDARLYKSHVWVYYANTQPSGVEWNAYSNGAGSFDPAGSGYTSGVPRYEVGDTAIFISLEDLNERFHNGLDYEKLALARAMEKYWYIPMLSMFRPTQRAQTSDRDGIMNGFPTLVKYLSHYRSAVNDQAEAKDFIRMRLGETYILLSEAYARKGDWANAAASLNVLRTRGAWKEGELKYAQFWKYDGGTWENRLTSTVDEMQVSAGFLSGFSSAQLTDFYVDEYTREMIGELNRFDILTRYGTDYWLNRVKTHNYLAEPNVKAYHRFRPIPQGHIDLIDPPDPNAQNFGY